MRADVDDAIRSITTLHKDAVDRQNYHLSAVYLASLHRLTQRARAPRRVAVNVIRTLSVRVKPPTKPQEDA